MAYGNILLGGVIGAGVDVVNGAAYDYPSEVSVPLDCKPLVGGPLRLGCRVQDVTDIGGSVPGLPGRQGVRVTWSTQEAPPSWRACGWGRPAGFQRAGDHRFGFAQAVSGKPGPAAGFPDALFSQWRQADAVFTVRGGDCEKSVCGGVGGRCPGAGGCAFQGGVNPNHFKYESRVYDGPIRAGLIVMRRPCRTKNSSASRPA
jgi:hypothetical protein